MEVIFSVDISVFAIDCLFKPKKTSSESRFVLKTVTITVSTSGIFCHHCHTVFMAVDLIVLSLKDLVHFLFDINKSLTLSFNGTMSFSFSPEEIQ